MGPNVYMIAAATLLITSLAYILYRKKRKFIKIGRVSKLILYPVKSLAEYEVDRAECISTGLKAGKIHDRMWTLINIKGTPVITLDAPHMALIRPKIQGNQLLLEFEGKDTLKIDIFDSIPEGATIRQCTMYTKKSIDGIDCGDKAAEWFQDILNKPHIRLLQHVPQLKSSSATFNNLANLKEDDFPILYQGANPFLILSQPSVDDLGKKTTANISHKNFRPNIIIDDCKPFDEDKFKYLKIGESAMLIRTIPCDRCWQTKIDYEEGKMLKDEPLKTLKTYRTSKDPKQIKVFGKKPIFGMNYGLVSEGEISVGDDIYGILE